MDSNDCLSAATDFQAVSKQDVSLDTVKPSVMLATYESDLCEEA